MSNFSTFILFSFVEKNLRTLIWKKEKEHPKIKKIITLNTTKQRLSTTIPKHLFSWRPYAINNFIYRKNRENCLPPLAHGTARGMRSTSPKLLVSVMSTWHHCLLRTVTYYKYAYMHIVYTIVCISLICLTLIPVLMSKRPMDNNVFESVHYARLHLWYIVYYTFLD